jgi:Arc/MetJ family transcription regulator
MPCLLSSRIMPRTTIDIDAAILGELKRIQRKEGASLGTVVSSLVAEALAARKEEQPAARRLRWVSRPMQACIGLDDKEAVWTALEDWKDH